jgi:hypothetical protein
MREFPVERVLRLHRIGAGADEIPLDPSASRTASNIAA